MSIKIIFIFSLKNKCLIEKQELNLFLDKAENGNENLFFSKLVIYTAYGIVQIHYKEPEKKYKALN
ncbi:hypothetical protein BpHYR1_025253 [Brachionus plicatilis]|uniref:Uncharacterized protein n=1 Tax=Brachionus plicatilis TaxID=10195 RepID=A0A3M7RRL5_BRAPC|nr:hypothetical protein BpHYR1_025253 [Brachionus plicatilis]